MNKMFASLVAFASCLVFPLSASTSSESQKSNVNSLEAKTTAEDVSLDQKSLFDKTRRGVVAITAKAYVTAERYQTTSWKGTGFVVDCEKGLIVTNAHVAGRTSVCSYEVKFGNGQTAGAKLLYIDPCYELAILSVDARDIPTYVRPLKISDEELALNTEIYSMGNSEANEFSTYKGYVFDTERILWLNPVSEQSFQFSGLTVPGASGSPVLNAKGEVVGLLYGGSFVAGAALPMSYVKPVVEALRNGKSFCRYFYGLVLNYGSLQDSIEVGNLPEELREEYDNAFPDSNHKIVFVYKKISVFNADKIELEPGDIIWKVDGELIGSNLKKIDAIVQKKAGKNLPITIYRKGKKKEIEIPTFEFSDKSNMKYLSFAGAVFSEMPSQNKIRYGKNASKVLINVTETGSPFWKLYCESGDYGDLQISSINGKEISTLDDLVDIISDLYKTQVFEAKFLDTTGDSQEFSITTRYIPEFAEATLYTFDNGTKSWNVKTIKNPSRES